MSRALCLIATSLPIPADEQAGVPLPSPVVLATITVDKRFIGRLNPSKLLSQLAGKMGLLTYTIVDADAQHLPGYQFELFAPVAEPR